MPLIIDLGEPTCYERCWYRGCNRKVGPYFSPRAAASAMTQHIDMRHTLVYQGAPWPPAPKGGV